MGLAVLTGGLAFVGGVSATELVVDGSFENTTPSNNAVVRVGGKDSPNVGEGWSSYSTYLYSTKYTLPGAAGSGEGFLRPYASGVYGITQSSETVTQQVSLTAATTLTPAKIDAGSGRFTASAWFSSYLIQGDFSDLTLEFLDSTKQVVGDPVPLGGETFVADIPTGANSRYATAKEWVQDRQLGTIPAGARFAKITVHSTSRGGAPDGYVDLVSLDVVDNALRTPAVSTASPGDNVVGVNPPVALSVTLEDRITAVDVNSVKLFLDGTLVTASVAKSDTNTLVSYNAGVLPAQSQHTYSIVFGDDGAPVTVQTNTYRFTVANYLALPAALANPLGSERVNQPGFAVRVFQIDPLVLDPVPELSDLPHSISFDEAVLAGLVAPNVADLTGAAAGNRFDVPDVLDWINASGVSGNFAVDKPFPGIPGVNGVETDFVNEIITYIRFPVAGFYRMGVNNNDSFKLTAATTGVQRLQLLSPTNVVIPSVAIATNINQLQFGGALPAVPLTAAIAYATPSGNPDDACDLSAVNLAGKIALVDRGGTTCDSGAKAEQAQNAGAVAVIFTSSTDVGFPLRLTSINTNVRIPVLVISDAFGGADLKAALTAGKTVTASLQGDPNPVVAEWDGPKGFGAVDVVAGFSVPTAGVYPFRLVADHGTGAANFEWFSVLADGTRILVNDTANPNALLAFRAISLPPRLVIPTLAGGEVTLAWTGAGVLQESGSISGPWIPAPNQANPQSVAPSSPAKFYRILQ